MEHRRGILRFTDVEVDERTFSVTKAGEVLSVEPKVFKVLQFLLHHRGRTVTKDELLDAVWNDCSVSESSLTRSVATLRRLLGDDIHEPRYIVTVPTVGYRFLCEVQVAEESASAANSRKPYQGFHSLAVLPFANGTGPAEAEYLSEGISESIINLLSQFPDLRVVPRTSAFRYKGLEAELKRVGRDLNVDVVLTGTVVQRGDRLIVQAELVDVAKDAQLWGGQYNRRLEDIFELQEELARRISESLRPRLTPDEDRFLARRPTANCEAYLLYLKAMYHANKWSPDGIQKGIAYSRQAIDLDPLFARAYSGLAYLYILVSYFGGLSPLQAFPMSRAATLKALEIDDSLATAHACLAYILLAHDWDWIGAERESRRAITLAPNFPGGHQIRSQWCLVNGLSDEAIAEATTTLNLDPLSLPNHQNLATTLAELRKYDLAIEQFQKALDLDSSFSPARQGLAVTYAYLGRYQEALDELGEPHALSDENIRVNITERGIWGIINAMAGRSAEAGTVLAEMMEFSEPPDFLPAYFCAAIHALLGAKDEAFEWLDRTRQGRNSFLYHVKLKPEFDALRDDPRFHELLHQMGIPN